MSLKNGQNLKVHIKKEGYLGNNRFRDGSKSYQVGKDSVQTRRINADSKIKQVCFFEAASISLKKALPSGSLFNDLSDCLLYSGQIFEV